MRYDLRALAPALVSLLALAVATPTFAADHPADGAWPGVTLTALGEGRREEWGYRGAGALVTAVESMSAADQIGIVPGDVVVSIGSILIRDPADLEKARERVDRTQDVPVVIARDHGRMLKVRNIEAVPTPAEGADAEAGATAESPAVETVAPESSAPEAATPEATAPEAVASETAPEAAPVAEVAPARIEPAPAVAPALIAAAAADPWGAFGARCADVNADLAGALQVAAETGAVVLAVTSGGPAERAGLRAGDVITAVAGLPLADAAALAAALAENGSGLAMHVQRGGTQRDVTVSVPAAAAKAGSSESGDALRAELRTLRLEVERLRAVLSEDSH